MPLNPLNWTAQPFLTLYVAVAAAAVLLVLALRRSASTGLASQPPAISDPVMLAWLAGGPRRAADPVLVAYLESGAADYYGRGRLSIDLTRGSPPVWFLRFAKPGNAAQSVTIFRRAIQPALEELRDTPDAAGAKACTDGISQPCTVAQQARGTVAQQARGTVAQQARASMCGAVRFRKERKRWQCND
jgi:hypothetical protein